MLQQEENEVQSWALKKIFWQQHKDARMKTDKRGTRWHPLFIKWCLYLRYRSSKAYKTLQDSGCIQHTLHDYSNYVTSSAGFSPHAANLVACEEWQKLVYRLIDEMEELVCNKHSGKLVGFCNLGEVNNHLLSFECSLDSAASACPPLAKTMMVLMVRRLFTPLRLVVYFAQTPH